MIDDVVFTLNGWVICRLPDSHHIRDLKVFVHHKTCQQTRKNERDPTTKNEISWLRGEIPVCWTCTDVIPDEIQALIYLHEWDKYDAHG